MDLSGFMYVGGIGIIVALVQVVKPWVTDGRFYPLISVAFGLIINVVVGLKLGISLTESIFMGVLAGLAASGLYSAGSTIKDGKPDVSPKM